MIPLLLYFFSLPSRRAADAAIQSMLTNARHIDDSSLYAFFKLGTTASLRVALVVADSLYSSTRIRSKRLASHVLSRRFGGKREAAHAYLIPLKLQLAYSTTFGALSFPTLRLSLTIYICEYTCIHAYMCRCITTILIIIIVTLHYVCTYIYYVFKGTPTILFRRLRLKQAQTTTFSKKVSNQPGRM